MTTPPAPLRRSSLETVLDVAFTEQAFTASTVMARTGLTRSTVLAACDELVRSGWITALDDARTAGEYRLGRPAKRYELHRTAGLVVGVDVGNTRIAAVVADLRGTVLAQVERGAAAGTPGDDARRAAVAACVADALLQADHPGSPVLVTTVGVAAPVDRRGGSPSEDDGFWHRMNPGFAAALSGYGELVVENDANLAAIAERARGAGDSFAALLSGERFGAGLIVDGVLLRGTHGGAGELRILNIVEGVGTPEGLGAACRTLAAAARAAGRILPGTPLATAASEPRVLDAPMVFAAAEADDPVALEIVERLAERLAKACIVLGSLLDIERVHVAGAIARPAERVIRRANALLQAGAFRPVPEVVASQLGADVVLVGAAQRALDTVRAHPLAFSLPAAARERTVATTGSVGG
ncbi:ROK family protein [Curtobacterium sp. 9128]|uniref:ROK family protein n=1 Tax=Curtobacterium sp. 9128 TaxID=1793722 RepID=UPI0021B201C5|nr:ROK family protein [Curtobacterium sp. 9128]